MWRRKIKKKRKNKYEGEKYEGEEYKQKQEEKHIGEACIEKRRERERSAEERIKGVKEEGDYLQNTWPLQEGQEQ